MCLYSPSDDVKCDVSREADGEVRWTQSERLMGETEEDEEQEEENKKL